MISLWLIVLWEFEESSHCPYRIHVDLGIREFTSNTPTHMRAHTKTDLWKSSWENLFCTDGFLIWRWVILSKVVGSMILSFIPSGDTEEFMVLFITEPMELHVPGFRFFFQSDQ